MVWIKLISYDDKKANVIFVNHSEPHFIVEKPKTIVRNLGLFCRDLHLDCKGERIKFICHFHEWKLEFKFPCISCDRTGRLTRGGRVYSYSVSLYEG